MFDFDQIFRKYHTPLFLYALKFVGNKDVALDLVQDVFTLLWERKKSDISDEYIKAYLFNALRNACLNFHKHTKVVQKHELYSITGMELNYYIDGEKSLIEKENLEKIYQAIDSLSEIHREIIDLSRFEGLKNKEIAERLNIPIRTVETRLFRALASLREKLSKKSFHTLLNIWSLNTGQ